MPLGALSGPTRITVRAPAGNLVGYDFQPHGLEFERPLTLMQDLLSTDGLGQLDLQAVYFDGELEPTPVDDEQDKPFFEKVKDLFG